MDRRKFKRGNTNLLRLAKILLDLPPDAESEHNGPLFCMRVFVHPCGAPACALGQWAANNPTRWRMRAASDGNSFGSLRRIVPRAVMRGFYTLSYIEGGESLRALEPFDGARLDFCLTSGEADLLFTGEGCGNAGNDAERAARFIENFVAGRIAAGGHVA